ncbi:protein SSXA1 isoform X2 [Cricetulus griseus]|uniref:Protein SSXA1 isoform X2 n=1 Tax=Cricetulus griseus TaxID=10029 RepID=A0A9J7GPC9_CRIGR|nr:protein SSXA1 isoform X2 [Cricetulus griseus]XP_027288092.2 protein SSXA1 isoform X2 [Cricetulus griseus]
MNRRRSCSVNVKKTEHNPEKTCKAFEDISKYFSKEEWAKMSYSEKITYVYMKRNYTTMTRLGLRTHLPDFMQSKEKATKSVLSDSDEGCGHESQVQNRKYTIKKCPHRPVTLQLSMLHGLPP